MGIPVSHFYDFSNGTSYPLACGGMGMGMVEMRIKNPFLRPANNEKFLSGSFLGQSRGGRGKARRACRCPKVEAESRGGVEFLGEGSEPTCITTKRFIKLVKSALETEHLNLDSGSWSLTHVLKRYILTSRPCTVLDWWTNFHCYYCIILNLANSLYAMRSVMAH